MISSDYNNLANYMNSDNKTNCNEPLTSVGIICIKLNKEIYNKFRNNLQSVSYYNLNDLIMENIDKFNEYNDMVSFLLVNRRHSLNYIDFIRGKYNINDTNGIYNIFSFMSSNEIEMIKNNEFNYLWGELWLKNAYKKKYLEEMKMASIKFLDIDDNNEFKYEFLGIFDNSTNIWMWAWLVPEFMYNETNIVRKLLNYGLKISSTVSSRLDNEKLYLKTQMVNGRFLLYDSFQLDLHLAISSYLAKDNIKFIYYKKKYLNKEKTKYISVYYLIY